MYDAWFVAPIDGIASPRELGSYDTQSEAESACRQEGPGSYRIYVGYRCVSELRVAAPESAPEPVLLPFRRVVRVEDEGCL